MSEETFNPFDTNIYTSSNTTTEPVVDTAEVKTEAPVDTVAQTTEVVSQPETTVTEPQNVVSKVEDTVVNETKSFEWKDDFSKTIYDKLVSKDIGDLADILYEQKVLSSLDNMDDSEILKLEMAYQYPDLTPEEIEEEFNSKYKVDDEIDEDMYTEDELNAKRKELDKKQKSLSREMKKAVREAKLSLQEMKKDIDFPDILSQLSQANPSEDAISQFMAKQQEEQQAQYLEARKVFESSINDGLKSFDGFTVNYKDEDVQFDGKFNITQEDKDGLQGMLKNFDLESFYGNRYYKDGSYDIKQLAEDVFLLQNRDKIVNAMVTQAVSKAKADILKNMKNIDYSNTPRPSATSNNSEYDEMVKTMFSL